ncbi:unnamed protein product [Toxocara canis]|uniref:Uncharacterized protein n=1 Tax=Toxocara canis TaxID=6265 RepID=A0A3P7F9S0_TOXCA|nr:unnamed protein product [Toxocara canis]
MAALGYLLPEEYVKTLSVLHSRAPESSLSDAQKVFEEDLHLKVLGRVIVVVMGNPERPSFSFLPVSSSSLSVASGDNRPTITDCDNAGAGSSVGGVNWLRM